MSKANIPQGISRRLRKELIATQRTPLSWASYELVEDNTHLLLGKIHGPIGTPYEGGVFFVKIELDRFYPAKPPEITFLTQVYHPNISARGLICMDILMDQWCPALTIENCLISIVSLLDDPGLENPLNKDVAEMYLSDRNRYEETVRDYVKKSASSSTPSDEQIARLWEGY